MQKIRISRRGQIVIPADIRKKYDLKDGEMLFIEDDEGVIKLKPRTKLRSLCGTWPELNIEIITKEIIEDREHEKEIEEEMEK
ncbi:MAG TPA: AbrB/MazE/SpoVT family DNA-binding domain-containing protein [Candidatus Methanoperedens sp.]